MQGDETDLTTVVGCYASSMARWKREWENVFWRASRIGGTRAGRFRTGKPFPERRLSSLRTIFVRLIRKCGDSPGIEAGRHAHPAQRLGVSPQTVANWESASGPINPQLRTLAALRRLNAKHTDET